MAGAVQRWELCAFNNLCRDKYERLGQEWDYKDEPLMRRADMERLCGIAAQSAGLGAAAVWTGAVRRETNGKEGGIHAGQDI